MAAIVFTIITFTGLHIFFLLFFFLSTSLSALPPALPPHTLPLHTITTLTLHTLHDSCMDREDELDNVRDGEVGHGQLVEPTRGTRIGSEKGNTTLNLVEQGE